MKIVIDNLNVNVSNNNVHIQDSYRVRSRKEIKEILEDIRLYLDWKEIDSPFNYRSNKSMLQEWITHNNLYVLNYERERTGSVDFNYPQKWYLKVGYFLGSIIKL